MAHIEIAPEVYDDFDRFIDHMERFGVLDSVERIAKIIAAIQILRRNPQIGRRIGDDERELIIGEGAQGYVALYRFAPKADVVVIIAIRHQSEDGYRRNP